MYKIGNALIIDDKIDLTVQSDKDQIDNADYRSLRSIQKYFLRNSIPFSVINKLSESFLDAIEIMKNLPKPDLVVLDLDLNSDGQIDETDISLIRVILTQLYETFGDFILLIYSSQSQSWTDIKNELLKSEPTLADLLQDENVIIVEKFFELTPIQSEVLGAEIIQKQSRYFKNNLFKIEKFIKSNWNSEVGIIAFFFISFILLIHFSLPGHNLGIAISAFLIIFLTTIKFIFSNRKIKHNEHSN